MRVTSEFFVSALIRRVFSSGGFAAIEHRGAAEAGAIFVRLRARDGRETLYGPAPQAFFEQDTAGDRHFEVRLADAAAGDVEAILARERKFDSDLWVVELEQDALGDLVVVTP